MKRILAFFLAAALLVTLAGCHGRKEDGQRQFVVVTSFYPLYLFTQNIAGGVPGVEIVNMTAPQTGCLHDYSLTAKDMKTLGRADVFVYNGAGLENFLGEVLKQQPELTTLEASKGLNLLKDEDGELNAHIWVSVSGAAGEVRNIAGGLEQLDPSHASIYHKNAAAFEAKLQALDKQMKTELAPYKGQNLITFHEAFPYFARDFELRNAGVVEIDPGTQPTAARLNQLIQLVRSSRIPAIFTEPQYIPQAAQTISQETGAKLFPLDPVVTGPMNDPDYYIEAMQRNLATLKQAFGNPISR